MGIEKLESMFLINDFASFVVNIHQMHTIGYFDERLLGLGKEDVDIMIRYEKTIGRPISRIKSKHIAHLESDVHQPDFQMGNTRHPLLNMIIYDKKISAQMENFQQYPYERFYRQNKHQIVKHTTINYEL
jgi:predicted glycosyltransferase involved in capsule biosynthesis